MLAWVEAQTKRNESEICALVRLHADQDRLPAAATATPGSPR